MIRPLALTVLLALGVVACGRATPGSSASLASPGTSPPQALAPAPAVPSTQPPATRARLPAEPPPEDRGDTALERLAQMPPDQQLPGARRKAGTSYLPIV